MIKGTTKTYINHGVCTKCMDGAIACDAIDHVTTHCKDGYYKSFNICKPCVSPCATCWSDTGCYTCGYDPEGRRKPFPSCMCDENYSDHGTHCDTCTAPCKTCFGFGLD